jgi:putative ABC transport system substrate-binding protein
MTRVSKVVFVALALLAAPLAAEAQQPTSIFRIGFLTAVPLSVMSARTEAFRQGLREMGYVEGKTILIEWRSAEGQLERLPSLAAELVRLKVDVIVTAGPSATRPAKAATETIPIVITNDNDPVANGFVASLARPGGNITGLSTLSPEIYGKQLELLKGSFRGSRAWRSWGIRPSRATLKRYERRNAPPGRSACSFNIWTSAVPTILRRPSEPHARGALTQSSC